MYNRVLFPTDGSEGAQAIFDRVLDLVETHGATLHVLNVADTAHDSVTRIQGEVVDVLEREGEQIVDAAAERAGERGISPVTEVVQGAVPETITGYAEEYDIDLIVMPTHGRTGVERVLVGSVTERVVRYASKPVLTLRPDNGIGDKYPHRTVLVPTDGSECADAALDHGAKLATAYGATLHVLTVVDLNSLGVDVHSQHHVEMLEEQANQTIEDAVQVAEAASVESVETAIEHGASISRTIRSYIDAHDVDLVVMGTHGRTGLDRYLIGSVTEKTVRTAPVPILTVPDPHREE